MVRDTSDYVLALFLCMGVGALNSTPHIVKLDLGFVFGLGFNSVVGVCGDEVLFHTASWILCIGVGVWMWEYMGVGECGLLEKSCVLDCCCVIRCQSSGSLDLYLQRITLRDLLMT